LRIEITEKKIRCRRGELARGYWNNPLTRQNRGYPGMMILE
jgi:hypothetical protein